MNVPWLVWILPGRRSALCVLSLAVLSTGAQSQDSSRSVGATVLADGKTFLRAAGFIFSAPVRWEGHDWALAGGTVGGTVASALLDNETLRLMNRNRTYQADRVSDLVVRYGDGAYIFPVTFAAYGAGLLLHDRWLRETAFLTASAILLSGTISTVTKTLVGRARPYLDQGNHLFKPFTVSDDDYLSFPSGHAIVAFSVSGVLARRIGNPWATAGLYLLAASTGWSRIYTLHHWLSDVLFSAATSTAVSGSLVSWFEGEQAGGAASGLRVLPSGNGLVVAWIF
ncbi:MAG TPA: phosphatase PAP2 family protein [Bacteroidota bacterium]